MSVVRVPLLAEAWTSCSTRGPHRTDSMPALTLHLDRPCEGLGARHTFLACEYSNSQAWMCGDCVGMLLHPFSLGMSEFIVEVSSYLQNLVRPKSMTTGPSVSSCLYGFYLSCMVKEEDLIYYA